MGRRDVAHGEHGAAGGRLQGMNQQLTPLAPAELERLRAEWSTLPVHDPRPRLLLMLDQARDDAEALHRLLVEQGRELRELRAVVDRR